jgi:hypothetical protein
MTNMNSLQEAWRRSSSSCSLSSRSSGSAYDEVFEIIQAKGLRSELRMSERRSVMADAAKLGMALTNPLNNAMRFNFWRDAEVDVERRGSRPG